MKRLILVFLTIIGIIMADYIYAADSLTVSIIPLYVYANMGDKITYSGIIANNSNKAVNNIMAYINLVNITPGKETPMDLEDWSANKAIRISTLPPHGIYEAKWSLRLIDSGSYIVYITVVDKNRSIPVNSTMSHLEINRILRLNPNNILPVAIGEPFLITILFMLVVFKKRKKIK